jgi:hypothetical protein
LCQPEVNIAGLAAGMRAVTIINPVNSDIITNSAVFIAGLTNLYSFTGVV